MHDGTIEVIYDENGITVRKVLPPEGAHVPFWYEVEFSTALPTTRQIALAMDHLPYTAVLEESDSTADRTFMFFGLPE